LGFQTQVWSTVKSTSHQIQNLVGNPYTTFDPKVKCVLVAIYKSEGKTILQPLTTKQELETIQELFQNKTLEVWLSNGETSMAQFDVAILKYKQMLQPFANCQRTETRVSLENAESYGQRPLGFSSGEITDEKF